MFATIWQLSYWTNQIGPNVVATVVCAVPAVVKLRGWLRRWREHERKVSELHELHTRPEGAGDGSGRVSKSLRHGDRA